MTDGIRPTLDQKGYQYLDTRPYLVTENDMKGKMANIKGKQVLHFFKVRKRCFFKEKKN